MVLRASGQGTDTGEKVAAVNEASHRRGKRVKRVGHVIALYISALCTYYRLQVKASCLTVVLTTNVYAPNT